MSIDDEVRKFVQKTGVCYGAATCRIHGKAIWVKSPLPRRKKAKTS